MTNEEIWNIDLIEILKERFKKEFPDIKIVKGKVLKDIFLNRNQNSLKNKIQFGFVDQDIVFYEEELDITNFYEVDNILIHNNSKSNKMIIPKLICELKYNGINSHGLINYSQYASDIKSIFPDCKYWLSMLYKKTSSENKLKRHGKSFDKIIFFNEGNSSKKYKKGDFKKQIANSVDLQKRFLEFVKEIAKLLKNPKTFFVK